jgi:hypothetical protein
MKAEIEATAADADVTYSADFKNDRRNVLL